MKVSAQFAQAQLDRARQIIASRIVLEPKHIGELVTLVIQGNGNLVTRESGASAMIYNVKASSTDRALDAKRALGTNAFFTAIVDMDEAGVQDHVNKILNASQLSFTVPLTSSVTFANGEIVQGLVSEYDRKATDENPAPGKSIGLNNVTPKKAVAVGKSAIFANWDEDGDATIEDNTDNSAQGASNSADPFADDHVADATKEAEGATA